VLMECKALAHLDLSQNSLDPQGARMLAGVLARCKVVVKRWERRGAESEEEGGE